MNPLISIVMLTRNALNYTKELERFATSWALLHKDQGFIPHKLTPPISLNVRGHSGRTDTLSPFRQEGSTHENRVNKSGLSPSPPC